MSLNVPEMLKGVVAESGDKNDIPLNAAIAGEADYTSGFPAITQLPIPSGGIPPDRKDFNGLFNILSQHAFWQQSGGLYEWSATLDYSVPALIVGSNGRLYLSLADSGPSGVGAKDPISEPTYWQDYAASVSIPTAVATGTVNAITATYSPPLTLADRTTCFLVCSGANTITNPTFAPDGLTAHTITKQGGMALKTGDIPRENFVALLQYDLANTRWELINPAGRTVLASAYTIYVATTGSDTTGNGTAGAPFATIQKAVNVAISEYDSSGFDITVSVANGTYAAGASIPAPLTGGGRLVISGNAATPASVLISSTAGALFAASGGANVIVRGFKLVGTSTLQVGLGGMDPGTKLNFSAIDFGSMPSGYHVSAQSFSRIVGTGPYSITGPAAHHYYSAYQGQIWVISVAVTITGTPAFSIFAYVFDLGYLVASAASFSGSATGTRYYVILNGVIQTNGGGANFFPGNAAGSTATGAQYA